VAAPAVAAPAVAAPAVAAPAVAAPAVAAPAAVVGPLCTYCGAAVPDGSSQCQDCIKA
jgi:hypothetical protein